MTTGSAAYIRGYYKVPAKRLGRVRYTGGKTPREGTITGFRDASLLIRLDGDKHCHPYHPTWEIEYLPAGDPNASPWPVPGRTHG